ncbi:MAG TPA: hypothetical protein V6D16_10570 [Candidatus Obscuribacterales bacterium]
MNRFQSLTQVIAKRTAQDIHKSLDAAVVSELAERYSQDALISGEAKDLGGYLYCWRQRAKQSAALMLAIAGLTLCAIPTVKSSVARLTLLSCSLGCILLARQQHKTAEETMPIVATIAKIQASYSSIQLAQLWATKPPKADIPVVIEEPTATLPYSPELFDWGNFRSNPDQFPHLMILGKTGSGKSLLSEWLLSQLGGKVTAVTPHRSPSDWKGIKVVGGGRNFQAIAEFFSELTGEMQRRYQLYDIGRTDFDPWNIAIDELPAIMAAPECGDVPTQLKELIREARKVKIRLLLLTQGAEVKALKFEGEGSIRDSLTFIRLGNFATDHARKLKDDDLLNWLKSQKRPCLVDDSPAIVPNLKSNV